MAQSCAPEGGNVPGSGAVLEVNALFEGETEQAAQAIKAYTYLSTQISNEYPDLGIAPLELSYVENLKNLGTSQRLRLQKEVLEQYKMQLTAIDINVLPFCPALDVRLLARQLDLDLARAELGIRYNLKRPEVLPEQGLGSVPLGKEWYAFFLKAWVGVEVTPEEIFAFGEAQTMQALARYRVTQKQLGFENNDIGLEVHLSNPAFYLAHDEVIGIHFENKQKIIHDNLSKLFKVMGTEAVEIKKSSQQNFKAPGYYEPEQKVFYYTLRDGLYNTRQTDWVLLHEGTPGHHYQISREKEAECQTTFPRENGTFREGWAAYVETLGQELGLYQRPEDYLGALEWDVIYSARIVVDIGVNYYGWSDEKALTWWKDHVVFENAIAQQEIDRLRHWPAQGVTHKYGADIFVRMKQSRQNKAKENFDIIQYHEDILRYGAIPVGVLEDILRSVSDSPENKLN